MTKRITIIALLLLMAAATAVSAAKPNHKKLAQQLNSDDVNVRVSAAKELRSAPKSGKFDPLILQACRDADPNVRVYGYYAIHKIDASEEGAVNTIIDGLSDSSVEVRRAAVSSLGMINPFPSAVIPYMVRALKDPDERVRGMIRTVFIDLEGIGMGGLLRHIDSKDGDLRLAIINTLGAMGPAAKGALLRLNKMAREDEDLRIKEAAERAVKNIERK